MYGTRPEAVKIAPVVIELRKRGVEPEIIQTGQHQSLLRGTPAENVLRPNVQLGLSTHNDPLNYARVCVHALAKVFRLKRPDVILVQGDTASAYAGAVCGKEMEISVAHVEAGIRTGDPWDPWPEENFRVSIDAIAALRFAPTQHAMNNLHPPDVTKLGAILSCGQSEYWDHTCNPPRRDGGTWVTGNTGIDALYGHTRPVEHPHRVQDRVLITLHRRESFGDPLKQIVNGIWAGAKKYPKLEFVWPTHPNPKVQEAVPYETLPNLVISGPLDMVPFATMLASSRCVITDSGGVQEEAAALGTPCIVAREKTDRPESVAIGLANVVGRRESGILQGLDWALGFQARCTPSNCFGDGRAASRIVGHLLGDSLSLVA